MLLALHIFRKKIHLFCILPLILILLLIGGGVLEAEGLPYVIGSVILNIEGKTNSHLLQNEMDLFPYDEHFETKEALVSRVKERKSFLFNKRIFESVDYTVRMLEKTEEFYVYQVVYNIIDAATFLPIPYGKYDSNYGMKLGVKIYDTNLFGSLSNMYLYAGIRQLDVMSFDQFEITSTMSLTNLRLFNQRFDVSMNFLINQEDGILKGGTYSGSLRWEDITLFGQKFDIFSNINMVQSYEADISIWGDPNLNVGFNWRDIQVFDEVFSLSFNTNLRKDGTSWSNPNLTFTSKLSSSTLNIFSKDISTSLEHIYALSTETGLVTSQRVNANISTTFSLPYNINYTISEKILTDHSSTPFQDIELVMGNTFTHGRINWVDNFREGNVTSLSISAAMPVDQGFTTLFEQFSTLSILQSTCFILLGDAVNISFRGVGYVATKTPKAFPVIPGEYMRGILDRHLKSESGYAGLSLNTNFTFKLFDFTIFIFDRSPDGEFLVSPFIDFSIFNSTSINDLSGPDWAEISGGIEFYVIFDSFRSYPFCATAGVNLKDIVDVFKGIKQLNQVEFEVLLSLSMFY